MSDGTSVGKISLEVDLQGDMKQQISDMANNLGTALKTSLEKATSGMLSGLEKVIGTAMQNINTSINEGLEKMKSQMDGFIKSIQAMTSKIKVPTKMPVSTNMVPAMNPVIPSVSPRGPPAMATGINGAAIQAEIDKVTSHLDLVNQKIELQKEKLSGLKESYDRALNPNTKNKLGMQINNTELSIMKLIEASDKMGFKLNDLDAKMNGTSQTTSKLGASVKVATNKIKESTNAINNSMGPVGKTADVIGGKFDKMGRMINSALKRVLIMATLYKVIRGFMSYMSSALATNEQFSNSLAIVKSNLQVAFIPIFNAILPALNTMMSALARVTTYIASFVSVLGGSTFKASTASAKALNKQKAAISGVGAATKKTAKEMERALAGFDEITNLNSPETPDAGGGGGGGSSAPIVSPGIDMSKFESGLRSFLDKLDPYLEPARQALDRLKEAFEPLKQNLFDGLKWLMDEVLIPIGKWVLKDVVPKFIDMLSASIKILNAVIEVLKPIFKWLWDNVLNPLAEWTGGVIVAVLDGIVEELETLATQITDTWKHVKEVWTTTRKFLVDTWESIKTKSRELWNNIVRTIKNAFNGIQEWFSGVFTGAWNGIKRAFSGVGSFFSGIWTTIKNTFTTIGHVIGTGIGNAFKTVVNSIIRFAENTINGFIRAINRAISLINKIPGVNISRLATLNIPKLATGGMIEQPTLAMVGEAGKEAVLPIDKDRGAMKQIADMLASEMGGGGGDFETTAEVDGDVLFKIVMRRLNKRRRQKGLPIIEY
ncbi:hypothetical protein J3A84_04890 [Proteiniclasticum sp. SCR006]|uniref:Phage-related protein n=1 Tax=Proteiniclasticum aestuarii TaxID=2817862 RepID=A0A939H535_9CLOT|nr:hypothetical protein [Proteiniclasticum aestuarii]MBO1264377.1 hypothetical protein [Proteiniclasticum aestuarii]